MAIPFVAAMPGLEPVVRRDEDLKGGDIFLQKERNTIVWPDKLRTWVLQKVVKSKDLQTNKGFTPPGKQVGASPHTKECLSTGLDGLQALDCLPPAGAWKCWDPLLKKTGVLVAQLLPLLNRGRESFYPPVRSLTISTRGAPRAAHPVIVNRPGRTGTTRS